MFCVRSVDCFIIMILCVCMFNFALYAVTLDFLPIECCGTLQTIFLSFSRVFFLSFTYVFFPVPHVYSHGMFDKEKHTKSCFCFVLVPLVVFFSCLTKHIITFVNLLAVTSANQWVTYGVIHSVVKNFNITIK